jgi:phosphoglycolate phosphatase-like HAD superfamily hydrolase
VTQPTFAVFDIDGVLADVTHRLHHIRGRRRDWAGFFADAAEDPLLLEGHQRAVDAARDHALVYLSGRPERLRVVTQEWLERHGLPAGALMLRGDRDRRPARVLKPEVLARVAAEGPIAFVVDDDKAVCDALRQRGYSVVHATWAAEAEILWRAQEGGGRT